MTDFDLVLLCALILGAATLYTSVGHAGASGYIAAMAIIGLAPDVMKPTALTLNILVAGLATARWTENGRTLAWKSLLPLVVASVPAAFVGGAYQLTAQQYRLLVGLVLLAAAIRFLWQPKSEEGSSPITTHVPWPAGLLTGACVGLLSGLTGTGGGIFLTPLLLLLGWAGARQASGLTAPFILLNSMAGLAGNVAAIQKLPSELPFFVAAAMAGALIGTQIGTRFVSTSTLQRLLGLVLLIASGKFLLG
ncbi:MAG: hypothetical protein B7Y80_13410 [Hyphomicrobium sp. 32-62-53]|nr:MAG: hypothetical protein B7Z29_12810 [Hyphomicrobium sp. 12-62-95]OYX99027.1 MAG: hypothetical protein B7Y80_13410 [Hyphomicrobium sp. 32-62-53]